MNRKLSYFTVATVLRQPISLKTPVACGLVLGAIWGGIAQAQPTVTSLYSFATSAGGYGPQPSSGVAEGVDGKFYGGTDGYVYDVSPLGAFTKIVQFPSDNAKYYDPTSVVRGADGNIYGTTHYGSSAAPGGGVFFKIANGRFSVLHTFTDMGYPNGVIAADDGNFYGTAAGTNALGGIFKVTSTGVETLLWSFDGTNGNGFGATLTEGTDGNFYGSCPVGGVNSNNVGTVQNPVWQTCGTLFRLTSDGTFTKLHDFNGADGRSPTKLVQGDDDNFYGFANGVFFQLTPDGSFSTIGISGDPVPVAGATLSFKGPDGSFYGTVISNVFSITPSGVVTLVAALPDAKEIATPLLLASDNNVYGTVSEAISDAGYLFRISGLFDSNTNYFGSVPVGSYAGLFYGNTITHQSSGYFEFKLATTRAMSGSFLVGGNKYVIPAGTYMSLNSPITFVATSSTSPDSLTVQMQLARGAGGGIQVTGTVSTISWNANLRGDQAYYTSLTTTSLAGTYTLTLASDSNGKLSPGHGSHGTITVTSAGVVRFSGVLSDGTGAGESTALSKSGTWPLYVNLYKGAGSILGWMAFDDQPTYELTGNVSWIKTGAFGTHYANGFTNQVTAYGSVLP